MEESPAEKTIRLGIEGRISDYYKADDMVQADANLEIWPHGKFRVLEHLIEVDEVVLPANLTA